MATLELRNLHKSYGSGLADTLRDIRLKIDSGEFLILVGPSGCGKSTLMNCIAGLESITGGAILVDGQDISGMSPKDRDIAMVFQSYALYPTMSVLSLSAPHAKRASFSLLATGGAGHRIRARDTDARPRRSPHPACAIHRCGSPAAPLPDRVRRHAPER